MSEVFLCKRGQLTASSKGALRKAGVVVVEVDDPTACQFIRSTNVVSGDEMLHAAIRALKHRGGLYSTGDAQRETFLATVMDLIERNSAPTTGGTTS